MRCLTRPKDSSFPPCNCCLGAADPEDKLGYGGLKNYRTNTSGVVIKTWPDGRKRYESTITWKCSVPDIIILTVLIPVPLSLTVVNSFTNASVRCFQRMGDERLMVSASFHRLARESIGLHRVVHSCTADP